MKKNQTEYSGWGNYPRLMAETLEPESIEALQEVVRKAEVVIPRGLGRSYGDSALSVLLLSLKRMNYPQKFDEKTGILTTGGGTSFKTILEMIIPLGWFLPVTPGTKHITLGGAIAADVHGKNHHKDGSFGDYVVSMNIMMAGGDIVTCSKTEKTELFHASIGGMGLLGIIVSATVQMRPIETSFISQKIVRTKNFEETMNTLQNAKDTTYSITWIDSAARGKKMGRGVVFLGDHAPAALIPRGISVLPVSRKKSWPIFFSLPRFALNMLSVKILNKFIYFLHPSKESLVSYDSFFYPLDQFSNWNRIYGSSGFLEYQCVVPKQGGDQVIRRIIEETVSSGLPAHLMGFKIFGKANDNLLSFPMEGYTLGIDFSIRKDLTTLFKVFDDIVIRSGGRLYLAKDTRMSKEIFDTSYRRAEEFKKYKRQVDPTSKFRSLQSMRLGLY